MQNKIAELAILFYVQGESCERKWDQDMSRVCLYRRFFFVVFFFFVERFAVFFFFMEQNVRYE